MTLDEGKKLVSQLFGGSLSRLGFTSAKGLVFVRASNDVLEIITFSGRVKEEIYYFTVGVGVRFRKIEKILGSGPEQQYFPTIGMPIHLLRDVRTFSEWSIDDGIDVDSIRDAVMSDIEKLALPFLNRFSSLERVRDKLESQSPKDWFTLDAERRIAVLAAIHVAQEGKTQALEMIEHALAERRDKPAKRRKVLEQLRKQLSQ